MKIRLLDTGPLVAYLDAGDPDHEQVSASLGAFTGRLATTSAVVTEAMYLVAADTRGPRLLAELMAASTVEVHDFSRPPALRQAAELMEKFANVPMDFADATLLLLADRLGVQELLTLDRRGFAAFRTPQGRGLHLVLELER